LTKQLKKEREEGGATPIILDALPRERWLVVVTSQKRKERNRLGIIERRESARN